MVFELQWIQPPEPSSPQLHPAIPAKEKQLSGTHVNAYLVDAIIGLSVVYKAVGNLGAFRLVLGFQPNTKAAVFVFGFFHGFGLATKLQEFSLPKTG